MLIESVEDGFALAGEHVQKMLDSTMVGAMALRESWLTLRHLDERERDDSDLQAAMAKLSEAYVLLHEAQTLVGTYSDMLNPYLARAGMKLVEETIFKPIPPLRPPPENRPSHDHLRTDMLPYMRRFRTFRSLLDMGATASSLPGYVNSGVQYHVFNNGDGTVLKVPRDARFPNILPETETRLAQASNGIVNVEQIRGYTTECGGGLLTEYVPGKTIAELSDAELSTAPKEHFKDLAALVRITKERGIVPDYHPTNTIYNPKVGFVLIDNHINLHCDASQQAIDAEAWCIPLVFSVGGPEEKTKAIEQFWEAFFEVYPDSGLWRDRSRGKRRRKH